MSEYECCGSRQGQFVYDKYSSSSRDFTYTVYLENNKIFILGWCPLSDKHFFVVVVVIVIE